jgi:hypothetical protein
MRHASGQRARHRRALGGAAEEGRVGSEHRVDLRVLAAFGEGGEIFLGPDQRRARDMRGDEPTQQVDPRLQPVAFQFSGQIAMIAKIAERDLAALERFSRQAEPPDGSKKNAAIQETSAVDLA